jgi:hypothetical protein
MECQPKVGVPSPPACDCSAGYAETDARIRSSSLTSFAIGLTRERAVAHTRGVAPVRRCANPTADTAQVKTIEAVTQPGDESFDEASANRGPLLRRGLRSRVVDQHHGLAQPRHHRSRHDRPGCRISETVDNETAACSPCSARLPLLISLVGSGTTAQAGEKVSCRRLTRNCHL